MTTNIIDRLNATINDRVERQLAQFDGLEAQIVAAIQQAEADAARRINAVAESIDGTLRAELAALDERLAVIATNAFSMACDRIAATLDPSTTTTPEPTGIPCPIPTYEEIQAEQEADPIPSIEQVQHDLEECREQAEEEYIERTTPAVAAHAVAYDHPAMIDEDDTDDNESDLEDASDDDTPDFDDDSAIMEDAGDQDGDGIATTYSTDDLYEKRGNGRGSRYTPVDFPEPGNVYYRKIDGRWTAVRLVG